MMAEDIINTVDISFYEKMLNSFTKFLPTLLTAVIVFLIGSFVNSIIIKLVSKGLSRSRLDKTMHGFVKSIVKVALYCFILVISLTILKIPMNSIIAVIGAAGLAVGLALQNSLSHFAGGFIVLFSKPFKVGDFIETNGISGIVEEISLINTKIVTIDNKAIYIPNGTISGSTIINYTNEEKRRVDLTFNISYNNDYKEAISIITSVINEHKLVLKDLEVFVRLVELASSSLKIAVKVWVSSNDYWTVYYDLIEQVKNAFDENNIVIPYNQLEIGGSLKTFHLNNSEN
jgi:small conductance mechanosensitive channel